MGVRREYVTGAEVVALIDDTHPAPPVQEERLTRALVRLFPVGCGVHVVVAAAWNAPSDAWDVRNGYVLFGPATDPLDIKAPLASSLVLEGIPIGRESGPARGGEMTGGDAKRRSPRLERQVPVMVEAPDRLVWGATRNVSRHGALVESRFPFIRDETLQIANLDLERTARFRVIWSGGPVGGVHRTGVELLDAWEDFWDLGTLPSSVPE